MDPAINEIGFKCCGCMSCVSICPVHALQVEISNGYTYPVVNPQNCMECGLCTKSCPVINAAELKSENKPLAVMLAKNRSLEERKRSTSGGIFFPLADFATNSGGGIAMVQHTPKTGRSSTVEHLILQNARNSKVQSMYKVTSESALMTFMIS